MHGNELWKTDGTESGTVMVKDINPGAGDSWPSDFIEYKGVVYLDACDDNNCVWWKTDGTELGTVPFGDSSMEPYEPIVFNGYLYFNGYDDDHGYELWRTDGTVEGTVMIKDIELGTESGDPYDFIEYNGNLYFSAYTTDAGRELWKSDGTESGTMLLEDVNPGAEDSYISNKVISNASQSTRKEQYLSLSERGVIKKKLVV